MPAERTEITEVVTGLATLGSATLDEALTSQPAQLVNVGSDVWSRLTGLRAAGEYAAEFQAAWANGRALLTSPDALAGRHPRIVEWKGNQRVPGEDPVPADLRIDHVYLVSCKYLSKILVNASPVSLFDHALRRAPEATSPDWYLTAAADAYQELYDTVRRELPGDLGLPPFVADLSREHRATLREHLRGDWSSSTALVARKFAAEVARVSAARWREQLARKRDREQMLWRLLRIANAPYFVLGASAGRTLRLRIATPWDWKQRYDLRSFEVWGDEAGQPTVRWQASIRDNETDSDVPVDGHVEVRWSHGRFAKPPEAKVYLDTLHHRVPGYFTLPGGEPL
ncbi:MAG: hypothetical protein R3A49_14260 [Acidimicrobiia bacterium]